MQKIVSLLFLLLGFLCRGQNRNWQNLDLKKDGVFGISTDLAYTDLLRNKTPDTVIVAVIDSGIDTLHEDLTGALWVNKREIPGNNIDDDHNGYVDDIYGWNFISADQEMEDLTRLAVRDKDFYDSLSYTSVPENYREGYQAYRKLSAELKAHIDNMKSLIYNLSNSESMLSKRPAGITNIDSIIQYFKNYKSGDLLEEALYISLTSHLRGYKSFDEYKFHEIDEIRKQAEWHLKYGLNVDNDKNAMTGAGATGNGNVLNGLIGLVSIANLTVYHGTHVSGIVSAKRDNGIGMNGIAGNVKIMTLKVLDNINELRDERLAMAIRYAADNGAKIINMSFGKYYSWNKKAVDDAVEYAIEKDVLFVLGAGNDGQDLDRNTFYPTARLGNGKIAKPWLRVGASGPANDSTLAAGFSNYGKQHVDVFAPGVNIYSTLPGSKYDTWSGTSMAAPIVSGLAALIRGYFPRLTATEVKDIIMKSVVPVDHDVWIRDNAGLRQLVPFRDLCVSGGIVNVYKALELAGKYSK